MSASSITVVLVGKTGFGKSATGNTLLGYPYFDEKTSMDSVTKLVTTKSIQTEFGYTLNVYDTPGLMDAGKDDLQGIKDTCEDMTRVMNVCQSVTAFLLVYNMGTKVSSEDKNTFEGAEQIFGTEYFWNHCILVLTKEDLLDVPNVEQFVRGNNSLKIYIEKCGNRVVPVCNKDVGDKRLDSKKNLIQTIISLKHSNWTDYTLQVFQSDDVDKSRKRLILLYEISNKDNIYSKAIDSIRKERGAVKYKYQRRALLHKIAVVKDQFKEKDCGTGVLQVYLDNLDSEVKVMPNPWCVIA